MKLLIWIFLSIGLAILCFFAGSRLMVEHLANAQVRVAPFVLQVESYNFDRDPEGEVFHKKVVARRSDGTTVVVSSIGPLSSGKFVKKITFPEGRWMTVFDLIQAKTTWQMGPTGLAAFKEHMQNPPKNCLLDVEGNPHLLREDVILGHKVVVVQSDTGNGRMTEWKAPDLSCERLQFRFESRTPDGLLKLKSEGRAVSLVLGEPPDSMFETGLNYRELKPSDAQHEFFEKWGVPEDSDSKESVERLDKRYSQK